MTVLTSSKSYSYEESPYIDNESHSTMKQKKEKVNKKQINFILNIITLVSFLFLKRNGL